MKLDAEVKVNPRIRKLSKLAEIDADDLKRMLIPVDVQFTKNERRLFKSEGASGGARWAPLSPRYAKAKRKKLKRKGKILQLTGSLRKALGNRNDPNHWAQISVTEKTLEVGAVPISKPGRIGSYHKAGIPPLPRRDPIQQNPMQHRRFNWIINEYLLKKKIPRLQRAMRWNK